MKKPIDFPKSIDQLPVERARLLIDMALAEDFGGRGDITAQALLSRLEKPMRASIIAREGGIVCGIDLAAMVYSRIDPELKISYLKKDGEWVEKGDKILELFGKPASITGGERTALNFLGLLSGVSTKVYRLTRLIQNTPARLLDTRKTIPGFRDLQKYAVVKGGGYNHRIGLYDMVLIKENHIAAVGGVAAAVESAKLHFPEVIVEIECETLEQVKEAAGTKAEILMLDNMDNEMVKKALKITGDEKYVEVSGDVDEKRLAELAQIGVDFVSMGALTHTVKPLNISLLIEPSQS
jgi:nicotinate-nucleotide pyrophosphorylase (carboxylating)